MPRELIEVTGFVTDESGDTDVTVNVHVETLLSTMCEHYKDRCNSQCHACPLHQIDQLEKIIFTHPEPLKKVEV